MCFDWSYVVQFGANHSTGKPAVGVAGETICVENSTDCGLEPKQWCIFEVVFMTLTNRDWRIRNSLSLASLTHKLYRKMDGVSPKVRTFPKIIKTYQFLARRFSTIQNIIRFSLAIIHTHKDLHISLYIK